MVTLSRCGVDHLLSTYHVYKRSHKFSWAPLYTTTGATGTLKRLSGLRSAKFRDVIWITLSEKCCINKCPVINSHIATIMLIIQDVARYLRTASSTRRSRATSHSQNSDMLLAETAEMRKGLLTLALAKVRKTPKQFWKKKSCLL